MAVRDRLFRALAVLRVVVLVNQLGVNAYAWDSFDSDAAAAVVMVVLVVWTAAATWVLADESRRTAPVLAADLAVAAGLVLASPLLRSEPQTTTVPGFMVMGALLSWAIAWRTWGGLAAAAVLTACDLAVRDVVTLANYGNIFLLAIGGPIVGYMCAQLIRLATERDRAEREAAAAAERVRLGRAVHDGVLQVLSLVQRRGAEHGGELAELGRMAAEQEQALRTLIRRQDAAPAAVEGTEDLAARLQRWESQPAPRTQVATPPGPVPLPRAVVEELDAAVGQCLSNVRHHVGPDADAWVLVEDLGDSVVVSVRDAGPGIAPGRLEAAEAEGRLGVCASIRGRLRDLGGSATLGTGSWGTEWELQVPRAAPGSGAP